TVKGGVPAGAGGGQRVEGPAAVRQPARGSTQIRGDSRGATAGYAGLAEQGTTTPVIFFKGESDRMSFVTTSPPMALEAAIPFVAVTLSVDGGLAPGLAIRQKALPNYDPFERIPPSIVDPSINGIRFR